MTPEQLKASILQRAMEGKLVPQDPNDEPASELLKRIKVEKEKLIKEGKIKRDKNETEIFRGDDGLHYEKFADRMVKEIEVPFEIPKSWEWVRVRNLGTLIRGNGIKKSETTSSGVGCVRYGELYTTYSYDFEKTISFTSNKIAEKAKTIEYGDALLTLTGENNKDIGKAIVYLGNEKIVMGGDLTKLTNYSLYPRFLSFLLNSPYVVDQKARLATGNIIVHISNDKIYSILVAVPPINEQERIVAQVELGFNKIEVYKNSYEVLDKINKEFPEKLRKSILQYAMQGKLVPQDPNDEPVEVLLERIRVEKQRLFDEGKIKKKDLEESIIYKGDDNSYYEKIGKNIGRIDVPYDLPSNMTWKRISDLYFNDGQTKPINTFNYIDTGSIDNQQYIIIDENISVMAQNNAPSRARKKVCMGSVLFSSVRPYLKNVAIFNKENYSEYIASTAFIVMNPIFLSSEYLLKSLISPMVIEAVNEKSTGSNYPAINDANFKTILIPVTSKDNQSKIVSKVDSLNQKISQLVVQS